MAMPIAPAFSDLTHEVVTDRLGRLRHEWRYNGTLHSVDDHPSVIVQDGVEKMWHANGLLHRDESLGPAWIKDSGATEVYYTTGEINRRNGPAVLSHSEMKWCRHSRMHRTDGPALIRECRDGVQETWWYDGVEFSTFEGWAEIAKPDPELYVFLKLKYS